jgi:hypothetical protein
MKLALVNVTKSDPLQGSALKVCNNRIKIGIRNGEHGCVRPKAKVKNACTDHPGGAVRDSRFFLRFTNRGVERILALTQRSPGNPPGAALVRPVSPQLK